MVAFEWGVALHDLDFEKIRSGEKSQKQVWDELKAIGRKARRQILKDYIAYPALSAAVGKGFTVARFGAPNADVANVVRNVWSQRDHLLRPLPRPDLHVHRGGGRERVARRLVRAAADRRGQHRRQPAVPRHERQPVLPGRAPPLPGHAELALPADRAAGEGDLREVRPAVQHRAAAQAVGHGAAHDPAAGASRAAGRGRSPARTSRRRRRRPPASRRARWSRPSPERPRRPERP